MEQDAALTPQELAVYALGFVAGVAGAWLMDRYAFVLQRRMVIGWAEHFCMEATGPDTPPGRGPGGVHPEDGAQ